MSTFAQSIPNWEELKWGMTSQEVLSLYPDKVKMEGGLVNGKESKNFDHQFKVKFFFNKDDKLYRLAYELLVLPDKKQLDGLKNDYHELKVYFSKLYGNPLEDKVSNLKGSVNYNPIWKINDNLFVMIDYFTFEFSPDLVLSKKDKQDLADNLYVSYDDPNHFIYLKKFLNVKDSK